MGAAIGLILCLILMVVGVFGLIRPPLVKLSTRWQAAFVLSAFIPLMGILIAIFPGNPEPPQTPGSVRDAGVFLVVTWLILVGAIWGVRKLIGRSAYRTSKERATVPASLKSDAGLDANGPELTHQNELPKVGLMRSISSALDSSLHSKIIQEIKMLPDTAKVDKAGLARAHNVPTSLISNLAEKARIEMLEAHLKDGLSARSLTKGEAQAYSEMLELGEKHFSKTWDKFRKAEAKAFLENILTDGQITPDEAADLEHICQILQIDFANRRAEIDEARKMWQVCNGTLEELDAPLMMKRGEICHGYDVVSAFEIRTRTKAVSYGGPSLRISVAKGLSFRIGHSRIAQHKEDHLHSFGTGDLCVTNKRLLWSGPNRTFNIPYDKIINIEPFTDGITIYKDAGKPLSFDYGGKNKPLSALILRVSEEARC